MPIGKLEFNLPEEEREFRAVIKSADYYAALYDIYQYLRREDVCDHGDAITPIPPYKIWSTFWEICNARGIDPTD
jgi:hypothetical protein